jgi:phage tail-like protein
MDIPPPIEEAFKERTAVADLILGFRFGVFFFAGGVLPNPLDIRFAKVSGLSAEVKTTTVIEGGENLSTHRLPERVDYGNLVLERGIVVGSPLNVEFNAALTVFKFSPSNVIVTLFSDRKVPLAAWMFIKAYPVKWSTADLDASEGKVVIDTMELAYTRMQILRI